MEGSAPRSEEAFQRLLLEFSSAAAQTSSTPALVRLFCKATRDFFQVDGVYFWRTLPSGEMVGAEADGWMADQFLGRTMKSTNQRWSPKRCNSGGRCAPAIWSPILPALPWRSISRPKP